MDIGGTDVIIDTSLSPEVASDLLKTYFQTKFGGDTVIEIVGPDEPHDFFFYTSQEVYQVWEDDVPTDPELRSGMIYVLCHLGEVTIVHEREDLDFDEIRRNLAVNWCY